MRLSTDPSRDEARGVAIIHSALNAGATLLDTADAYCWDEREIGHNERLIASAVRTWNGDRTAIRIASKGGLTRPGGRWVPNGRAKHLRAACVASIRALDVDAIDLYQLHVVDPKTPLTTSVRALDGLRDEGLIREIGLCNVNVQQIKAARDITAIASVQVSLSPFDEDNFRNGVAAYCREHDIRLIAYRPFGGEKKRKALTRDALLAEIAASHDATPFEVTLAWLCDLDDHVVPIPGATRVEHAGSLARVSAIALTDTDRDRLDERFPAGRVLRIPRAKRRPAASARGEVVVLMGMPAAGKSTAARALVDRGYERLNRDERGGALADLIPDLAAGLASGRRRWVLDNTYPSRKSRNLIECAWKHGVPARCIWLKTSIDDAQINAVSRMLASYGRLPSPDEIRARAKSDPTTLGPNALFRYDRELETPVLDEGFTAVDEQPFVRRNDSNITARALLLEYDDVLCTSVSGKDVVTEPDDVALVAARRENVVRVSRRRVDAAEHRLAAANRRR